MNLKNFPLVCCDLESVLIGELWVELAHKTGIEELKKTTREEPDYDKLMKMRLQILEKNNLKLSDIEKVVKTCEPLPGAREFLDWLRTQVSVVILSDTFIQFAQPLMKKLNWPVLFCHSLIVDKSGKIIDYKLRQKNHKQEAVKAFQKLNYKIISFGDSYNDVKMLQQAEHGFLFSSPKNVRDEFPEIPTVNNYKELKNNIIKLIGK